MVSLAYRSSTSNMHYHGTKSLHSRCCRGMLRGSHVVVHVAEYLRISNVQTIVSVLHEHFKYDYASCSAIVKTTDCEMHDASRFFHLTQSGLFGTCVFIFTFRIR